MIQAEEIKARVSVEDVLAEQGIVLRRGRCRCPLHDGDNPTSFSVRDGGFRCFACGESGDVISLVEKLYRLDFQEALDYLAAKAGISDRDFEKAPRRQVRLREIDWDEHFSKQEDQILDLLIRLWEKVLKTLDQDLRDSKMSLADYYSSQQWAGYQLSLLDELSIQRNYEKNMKRRRK